MGGYCAHFLFDNFQGFSRKVVFFYPFQTVYTLYKPVLMDKPVMGSTGCRSPPFVLIFPRQTEGTGTLSC